MRVNYFLFWLGVIVLFNIAFVSAGLSISPAKFEIDYQPGVELKFSFLAESDSGKILDVFAGGEFAEFVSFDKSQINGSGSFTAVLKMPESTEKYGRNSLYIRASENLSSFGGGVGTSVSVGALIAIRVPYPGKYAEITSFSADSANFGDDAYIKADIASRGRDAVSIEAKVITFKDGDETEFDRIALSEAVIGPADTKSYNHLLDKQKYLSGNYRAKLVISFEGKELTQEVNFRIGTLFMNVTNWTRQAEAGKISRFFLTGESFWGNKIQNVYGAVNILDKTGNLAGSFKTLTADFAPFEKKELEGYIDATELKSGEYTAEMTLAYAGKNTTSVGRIDIIKKSFNYTLPLIIGGVLIILAFAYFYFFARKRKK